MFMIYLILNQFKCIQFQQSICKSLQEKLIQNLLLVIIYFFFNTVYFNLMVDKKQKIGVYN